MNKILNSLFLFILLFAAISHADKNPGLVYFTSTGDEYYSAFGIDTTDAIVRKLNGEADWTPIFSGTISQIFFSYGKNSKKSGDIPSRVVVSPKPHSSVDYLVFTSETDFYIHRPSDPQEIKVRKPQGRVTNFSYDLGNRYQNDKYAVIEITTTMKTEIHLVRQSDMQSTIISDSKIALVDVTIAGTVLTVKGKNQNLDFDLTVFESKFPKADRPIITLPKTTSLAIVKPRLGLDQLRKNKQDGDILLRDLKSEIFGQDYALEQIARQYNEQKKNQTGRPKVLIAMGPSGGGKTFTAGKLAARLNQGKVFEISGNEYKAHSGSLDYTRLFGTRGGSGPQDGALVKFAKDNQNGFTLLINEGEKMHPDIWMMFMEILDTGFFSDKDGAKVKVENLWVVITSNRGSKRMFPATAKNWSQSDVDRRSRELTQEVLKGYFESSDGVKDDFKIPPEIMNRVDQLLAFGPTTREAAVLVADFVANELSSKYYLDYGITVNLSKEVNNDIALAAWSTSNDARTIRRAVNLFFSELLDQSLDGLELKEGNIIEVKLAVDESNRKKYVASANNLKISMSPSVNPLESPLLDVKLRERLKNLKPLMNQTVIGQEETINEIADGVLSHYGRGKRTRPFSAYLLGVSGNGKTEIGRALARVIHNSDSQFSIIPMGGITEISDFDNVFGSSAKFQGGDIERLFEKALRENPDGSVIILDEISNMGGGNKSIKTALFQKLYDFLEEGRYISPIDGREYDLSKYQFIMTGNDGEEAYRGVTADDMLMEIWKQQKDLAKLRDLMRAAGIPNAFINRLNVVAHTKPLLSNEIVEVTQKLWKYQIKEFLELNRGIKVDASENLLKQLSRSFFTADQGGRAVRKILEDKVGALLLHGLLKSDADLANLAGYRILVDLTDTESKKPYRASKTEREVLFKAQVYKDNKLVHTEIMDVKNITPKKIILGMNEARLTGFHEGGHILGNDEKLTGQIFEFSTIRGGSTGKIDYYGYARYKSTHSEQGKNMTREWLIARLAGLYSGRKAQEMAGYPADAGWEEDLRVMRKLTSQYLLTSGLEPEFVSLPLDKEGNPILSADKSKLFDRKFNEIIHEGEVLAYQRLKDNWRLLRAVVAELILKGEINRDRYLALKEQFGNKTTSSKRQDWKSVPYSAGFEAVNSCKAFYSR